ncbi:DUF397 domain-containing protein [Streptomyces sp. NPDC048484]|uniref:DUF397 domain-containing protein n=1 Tax=Streptomyces sp. NPDC048484 TaxID=3155146 RepID=UPI003420DBD8
MTDQVIPNAALLSGWRTSSYSNSEGGSCVEVVDGHPSGVPVRDSKNPHGPAVIVPASAWSSFVAALRSGDLPS